MNEDIKHPNAPKDGGTEPTKEYSKSDDLLICSRGLDLLQKYKNGKASLDKRIVDDELFWRMRHHDLGAEKKSKSSDVPLPTSAWLFNTIINKHADLMDSYPSAVCLPRERSDEDAAKTLTSIIPVIMERCGFNKVYSDNAYYKIKHGTSAYGVFWDSTLENGLGDISIKSVDLLNLFWEPGISDIQKSKNLFCVSLAEEEDIKAAYPDSGFESGTNTIDLGEYVLDDYVDSSSKALVVDWYYKKNVDGRIVVHFIKFSGNTVLYSSERDPEYAEVGFYNHGMYPFVFDVMYPESGTPYGFGIISVTKDAQVYIDRLDANILEHSLMQSKMRFLVKKNVGINMEEYTDFNNPFISCEGDISEERFKPLNLPSLDSIVVSVREAKINEMKEVSANRDVNSGGTTGGVTSGAAIATLQEAGNKVSRDIINTSYAAYVDVVRLVIELMRQFYTEERTFRVLSPNSGTNGYVSFSADAISEKKMTLGGDVLHRVPIFDIDVRAEKHSPFARLSQNETIMNLYGLGFFNPENAQAAIVALEGLEFEGKDKILDSVREGYTLMNTCKQLAAQVEQLTNKLGMIQSAVPAASPSPQGEAPGVSSAPTADRNAMAAGRYAENKVISAQSDINNVGEGLV